MLSLDFSCSGKGEPLFGTGISLHFWHFALVFCKLFSLDNQPDIALPQGVSQYRRLMFMLRLPQPFSSKSVQRYNMFLKNRCDFSFFILLFQLIFKVLLLLILILIVFNFSYRFHLYLTFHWRVHEKKPCFSLICWILLKILASQALYCFGYFGLKDEN